jgi:DNA-binding response OmpR family regulator
VSEPAQAAAPRTALVADDSVAVRRLVAARLGADGYEVREAEDGVSAWAQIQERAPDLLLVDDVLPGLSGIELVQLVRARAELAPVRIGFVVEYGAGARRAALAGLPADAVIRKPFDLDELSARVAAL